MHFFICSRYSSCILGFLLLLIPYAFAAPALTRRTGFTPILLGSSDVFGAGTYPRATLLPDGSILGVYKSGSGDAQVITTVRSIDSGVTWLPQGTVTIGSGDIDNPNLLVLSSGRILCAFRNHSKDVAGAYTYFRITVCYSDDNGVTWQYLSQPASDPGPAQTDGVSHGNWEPFLRLSSVNANQIQIYYSREAAADNQDSLMRTSTDGGSNWSLATVISGEGVVARDGMVGVATLPAGGENLIAVFESVVVGGPFSIWTDTSSDDGVTWNNRRQIYTATGSNNNAGAPQILNVEGTLVVSFMTDEDTSAHVWADQAATKIITSTDGSTWGSKSTVFGVSSYWPGLLRLDDSSLLVLSDFGGAKSQKVVLS